MLETDPLHVDTIRLIFRLALEGDGDCGCMGVRSIAKYLNERKLYTRTGGRWGVGTVHRILMRRAYIGGHEWGKTHKDGTPKTAAEVVTVPVPPIVNRETFDAVQQLLKKRAPMVTPGRTVSGPTLLTGICFCAHCGGAMTLRASGKAKHYRYYICSTAARQGKTGCKGRKIRMDRLDHLVVDYLEHRLLDPNRVQDMLAAHLDRREERDGRRRTQANELTKRAVEAEQRPKRLYDAIESGVASLSDPSLKELIEELKATRDQAYVDAERARAAIETAGQSLTPAQLTKFASVARRRMRGKDGGFRRDHPRAFARRVEVAEREVRIMGSRNELLRLLTSSNGVETAANGVRTFVPGWRRGWDSNPRRAVNPCWFSRPVHSTALPPLRADRWRIVAAARTGFNSRCDDASPILCDNAYWLEVPGNPHALQPIPISASARQSPGQCPVDRAWRFGDGGLAGGGLSGGRRAGGHRRHAGRARRTAFLVAEPALRPAGGQGGEAAGRQKGRVDRRRVS